MSKSHNNCPRDNCFAYGMGKCKILTSTYQNPKDCPFFKTKRQLEMEAQKYGTRNLYSETETSNR